MCRHLTSPTVEEARVIALNSTWQGESGAKAGWALDIELEIADPVPWGAL